jgi:cold shock CspA family protein
MVKSGRVAAYNPDSGSGVIIAEDEAGSLGENNIDITYEMLAPDVASLHPGQKVTFALKKNKPVGVRPTAKA